MGRGIRIVVPGLPHHVTQRGNLNADVFDEDGDRFVYLSILRKHAERYGLDFWAYCLMTNHVHLIAVPSTEDALPWTLRDAHRDYARWFNRRRGITGHLWHGRYYSTVMDETHLWAAVRYVERNPVRAGLVSRTEEYPWSSAATHCGLQRDPLVAGAFPIDGVVKDWRAWLADEDLAQSHAIRRSTAKGYPVGSQDFVDEVAARFKIDFSQKRRGRPSHREKTRHG